MASDKGRQFTVTPGPEGLNRDEVIQALVDAEAIMHRQGGTFTVSSIRAKVDNPDPLTREAIPHVFETVGYVLRHVYSPHIDLTGQAPETYPEDPHFTAVSTEPDEMHDGYEQFADEDAAIAEETEPEEMPPGLEDQATALEDALENVGRSSS